MGTPGALVAQRDWDDYSIGRAGTLEHLGALDVVYAGIIEAHRRAIDITDELDQVTQDMLIGQSGQLEEFHRFVRAHLEAPDGSLSTGNAQTEKSAAKRAKKFADRGDLRWPGPCGALPGSPRGILRRVNERDSPTNFQGTGH